jgi:hypothetical protein
VRELMGHLAAATRPQGWTLSVAWKSIDVHCKKREQNNGELQRGGMQLRM